MKRKGHLFEHFYDIFFSSHRMVNVNQIPCFDVLSRNFFSLQTVYFRSESIWNALRWLLTIVQFCGMSLTRHNNPLRIVKSSRLSFPKSCCHHCEKVYHFSIGRPPALLETNTDPCEVSQLSIIRYFFVHVNSFDKYKLFPRTYYRYCKFVDSQ